MTNQDKINSILQDREYKNVTIKKYSKEKICLSLKANIPGIDKNIFPSKLIIEYFENRLDLIFEKQIINEKVLKGSDGIIIFYILNMASTFENAMIVKRKTIELEEKFDLGRLIDIDVHYSGTSSIRREKLRRCLICDDIAFKCNRLKKHSDAQLIETMKRMVEKVYSPLIKYLIELSMRLELDLHPKFGLVTPYTNGSHSDMDYVLMSKSISFLIEPFYEMFKEGISNSNLDDLFPAIRKIGLQAEKDLYVLTNGVNTYKGLIFGLGIVIAASGYFLANDYSDYSDIFEIISTMTSSLKTELDSFKSNETYGIKAYREHKIGGARLEAYFGFPCVREVELSNLSYSCLLDALIKLIYISNDTILYKRAGSYEKYLIIKEKFQNIRSCDVDEINDLNYFCIQNNLSFGGAADLLIISIYLYLFKRNFLEKGGKNEKQNFK